MKFDKFGWVAAAALAGALATSGFQGPSLKFANVDMEKVLTSSDLFKHNSDEAETYRQARFKVIQFLGTNLEMTPEDAKEYAELSLKKSQSDADRTRLTRIATDAAAQVDKHHSLMVVQQPTADQQATMGDFATRMQKNRGFAQQLDSEYTTDLQKEMLRLQTEAADKVRKVVRDIATSKGYNIVFSTQAAPYAANNLTDEAITAINKS